jgi:uncharacterized cupredoxin-like copper-binding protein
MKRMTILAATASALLILAAACESSGAGGREVRITQTNDGCTPASVSVRGGEKLKLTVQNKSDKDYEIEGIDGAKLEELVVPSGKTRTPGYTVPGGAGTHKLKCYVPGGVSTIIELVSDGVAASTEPTQAGGAAAAASPASSSDAKVDVQVKLAEWSVTADKLSVVAGKTQFEAANTSTSRKHELAVLKVKDDGSFDNLGEIEPMEPGKGGEIVLDLKPGKYQLACLITPGEGGSTVDHYKQGMRVDFTVQ